MLRALLIEDNAAARADLRDRLQAHPEVTIVNEAESVGRARPILARGDYDLVFFDIQLRGGSAFDLVPLVVPTAHIIFVTAHDEYALRAFEVNALDYLLKPVSPERLARCLGRLMSPASIAPVAPLASALRADDLVCIQSDDGSQFVPLRSIAVILADQNYTSIWLTSGQRRLVRRPLKEWEQRLPTTEFMRISRDTLVNLKQVSRYEKTGEKGGSLWVAGHTESVRASNRHWTGVRAALARHLIG